MIVNHKVLTDEMILDMFYEIQLLHNQVKELKTQIKNMKRDREVRELIKEKDTCKWEAIGPEMEIF